MDCEIREWKIEDKTDLAHNLNNVNILNNLRDGLPFPIKLDTAIEMPVTIISSLA